MSSLTELTNVICESIQRKSLDTLNTYFISYDNWEKLLNTDLILILKEVLKKNRKHEGKAFDITCVLDCLQHFLNTVQDSQKWEKVSEDMSKLCDGVFVISCNFIKDETLIKKAIAVISAILDVGNSVADDLLRFMMTSLLAHCLNKTFTKHTRLLIMILISSLLQKSSRRIRSEIIPTNIDHLNRLSNILTESDDYETQVSVVEILARTLTFIETPEKSSFFGSSTIWEMYKEFHPFINFDPDCRQFLNRVNGYLGDQQKVFPVPCMIVSADDNLLRKPNDPNYSDFWVDFNLGARSISFYYQPRSSESWELMTVPEENVMRIVTKDSACQSRSGEKFEAVKIELTIDSSNLSPSSELPSTVKIYPQKDKYLKIEHVIKGIFKNKYQLSVNANEDNYKIQPKLSTQNIQSSEEKSSAGNSNHSRLIEKTLKEDKSKLHLTRLKEIEDSEAKSIIGKNIFSNELSLRGYKKSPSAQESKSLNSGNDSRDFSSLLTKPPKAKDSGLEEVKQSKLPTCTDNLKTPKPREIEGNLEQNRTAKKKLLYSFDVSNEKDVVMSSQEQELSIKMPSYKIKKKEDSTKEKLIVNRKNISYSYIANKGVNKSDTCRTDKAQKEFNFEDDKVIQVYDDNDSKNSSESSSHTLFKDPREEPEPLLKLFTSATKKDISPSKSFHPKSLYCGYVSPEKTDITNCEKTYKRSKPKRPWRRLKAVPIASESSDSDSQYVPPTKLVKEGDKKIVRKSPIRTRFAHNFANDKIDPTRDINYSNEIKMEIDNDFEEPKIKPREIVADTLTIQGKVTSKTSVKVGKGKKKSNAKSKVTKPAIGKNKNSKIKNTTEGILENIFQKRTDCMDVMNYEPPEACSSQDLELDILSNDNDEKALIRHTTFKATDMERFGRMLIKQVQEKITKAERLVQKEREMNFATFDFKLQTFCNELYGKSQSMESVTDKLEKLNIMIQSTYKLHKEIAAQINSEVSKIEEAKSDLLKNANKIKKTESSSISSVFQGFGGYLKKLVLSFIQRNPIKNAITD
ncbi:synaptonemal complex protein 2-like isoform X2 [Macrosteles quadrilineatus]|uniref:synaptonemal complex protein 2-like isoform X2 n=1 Tax=Macrosteles quadrilineatus TaxID=74068 RepID=UPI0023E28D5E|nr:synaptonemal complex protein 2-like isoform X2 [Macrosteles quadrilineatus]